MHLSIVCSTTPPPGQWWGMRGDFLCLATKCGPGGGAFAATPILIKYMDSWCLVLCVKSSSVCTVCVNDADNPIICVNSGGGVGICNEILPRGWGILHLWSAPPLPRKGVWHTIDRCINITQCIWKMLGWHQYLTVQDNYSVTTPLLRVRLYKLQDYTSLSSYMRGALQPIPQTSVSAHSPTREMFRQWCHHCYFAFFQSWRESSSATSTSSPSLATGRGRGW